MEELIKYRDYLVLRQQYFTNLDFQNLATEYQTIINYFNQFIKEKENNVQTVQEQQNLGA